VGSLFYYYLEEGKKPGLGIHTRGRLEGLGSRDRLGKGWEVLHTNLALSKGVVVEFLHAWASYVWLLMGRTTAGSGRAGWLAGWMDE